MNPFYLRCELQNNPLGIDTPYPRLSWQLQSNKNGEYQKAYQIIVDEAWDSGKILSSHSIHIEYGGQPLVLGRRYNWKVRVWNQNNEASPWSEQASWTMGFLTPDNWSARWICSPGNRNQPQSSRLQAARWIWASDTKKLPLPALRGSCKLSRKFQLPTDAKVCEAQLMVAADCQARILVNGKFVIQITHWQKGEVLDVKNLLMTGENILTIEAENKSDTEKIAGLICHLHVHLENGSEIAIVSDENWQIDSVEPNRSENRVHELAAWGEGPWGANVYFEQNADSHNIGLPVFKKTFIVDSSLESALVNVSGLGQYQLLLNNNKVGDHFLDPPWSVYDKTVYYNTFDISDFLRPGENEFKIILGKGYYNSIGDRITHHTHQWGELMTILEAELKYADGRREIVMTDDSWEVGHGPIQHDTLLAGCDYDARLEEPSTWSQARETRVKGVLRQTESPPMKKFERLIPIKTAEEPEPNVFVYDFGQNLSALPHINVRGKRGQVLKIKPAEQRHGQTDRHNNGTGCVDQAGVGSPNFYQYTLRGNDQQGKDSIETWEPPCTYSGFQYLEVTGAVPSGHDNPDDLPVIEKIQGIHVRSSSAQVGSFACSNPLWMKIAESIDRAVRSNLAHLLTDCPTREKLGWLEVSYLMGPSISRRYDLSRLYAKITRDIRDTQGENGAIYTTAPSYASFDINHCMGYTVEWGAAGVVLPWQLYRWYGDIRVLSENFSTMKSFVNHIENTSDNLIPPPGLGDWFDYGHGQARGPSKFTPPELSATATFYRCCLIVAKTARVLGYTDEDHFYGKLAKNIKKAFNLKFYKGNGVYQNHGSPQTANAMALVLGLCEPEEEAAALEAILVDLKARDFQQTSGDVGFHYLVEVLGQNGCDDAVSNMLNRREEGSYGFIVDRGWSALPETWEAATKESMNHCMLGHIQQWFYQDVLGIKQSDDSVAFEKIIIKPAVQSTLEWAKGHYDSIRGRISSSWRKSGTQIFMEVSIPTNATATIQIPTSSADSVQINGQAATTAPDITNIEVLNGSLAFHVGSGSYEIIIQNGP